MKWTPQGPSEDLEDRRGSSGGGMRRGAPVGLGIVLVLGVLSLLTGRNFLSLLGPALEQGGGVTSSEPEPGGPPPASSPEEAERVQFVSFVLDDAQQTWASALGPRYERTKLVLFRDGIESACGFAQSASGPFYCPGDRKVYIDLSFYDELKTRFGAAGDFAQAYVLAHEIGHHVQTLLDIEPKVRDMQQRRPDMANQLSVRMELQADCLAGVWGHSTAQRQILEQGDVEEGLNAAASIGDDRIQKMATGRVHPEGFTHGTSAQRVEWFRRGLQEGTVDACDTFGQGR
ncbi:MAG: neutral zinc metallopeptidase [Vicinamibacterales bacterium]